MDLTIAFWAGLAVVLAYSAGKGAGYRERVEEETEEEESGTDAE